MSIKDLPFVTVEQVVILRQAAIELEQRAEAAEQANTQIFDRMMTETNHLPHCNANHSKPVGGDGCICVRTIKHTAYEYKVRAEAAEAKLRELEWQPIGTLPKDGGTYLIADAVRGFVVPHIRKHDWQYGELPTHWMPLPPAPKQEEK